jgi:hypothetical protein
MFASKFVVSAKRPAASKTPAAHEVQIKSQRTDASQAPLRFVAPENAAPTTPAAASDFHPKMEFEPSARLTTIPGTSVLQVVPFPF